MIVVPKRFDKSIAYSKRQKQTQPQQEEGCVKTPDVPKVLERGMHGFARPLNNGKQQLLIISILSARHKPEKK